MISTSYYLSFSFGVETFPPSTSVADCQTAQRATCGVLPPIVNCPSSDQTDCQPSKKEIATQKHAKQQKQKEVSSAKRFHPAHLAGSCSLSWGSLRPHDLQFSDWYSQLEMLAPFWQSHRIQFSCLGVLRQALQMSIPLALRHPALCDPSMVISIVDILRSVNI